MPGTSLPRLLVTSALVAGFAGIGVPGCFGRGPEPHQHAFGNQLSPSQFPNSVHPRVKLD